MFVITKMWYRFGLLSIPFNDIMQALAITYNKLPEPPRFISAYTKKKLVVKHKTKTRQLYPKILMPEQPEQYIKQRNNDCW